MGSITWSKSWSASDNGSIFAGADIQNIQNDITTVVNGGLTNSNINASAAIVESKIAFNISSGHDHDGTDSKLISASNTHFIKGCEVEWVSAATVKVQPGVLELNGTVLSRVAYSTTLNLATAGHWVSGSEGASAWYYIYAYNDSGTSWDVKLSDEAPAYYDCDVADASGFLRYRDYSDVWYRCIGKFYNNSASDIDAWSVFNWEEGQPIQGIVKAWINFNGTGTIAINDSYNVAAIGDVGAGQWSITWDTDFANDDYAIVGSGKYDHDDSNTQVPIVGLDRIANNPAVGIVYVNATVSNGSAADCELISIIVIGD